MLAERQGVKGYPSGGQENKWVGCLTSDLHRRSISSRQ